MWKYLNTPDNFKDDWYGELTNQVSHTTLGALATLLLLCAWREVMGEMPVRSALFLIVFLGYAVGIEMIVQSWKAGDSWFDAMMFIFGSAFILFPFRELDIYGSETAVAFSHRYMAVLLFMWASLLALRVSRRYRANQDQD